MSEQTRTAGNPLPIFIDTDVGCDDALAIAWLLQRDDARVVGFTTVYGNSSVQNTSANLLTLLDALGCEASVTVGASAPLAYPRTNAGALSHGPDGLWGAQIARAIDDLPQGAPGAIAAAARANPGLTIIALGPLTNIARAVQAYPEDLAGVRLVALGGARYGGNITPVAEFNIFADPHALAVLLESRLQIELLTLDAFDQLVVDSATISHNLAQECGRAGQLLAHALGGYTLALTRGAGGPIAIPDAAAAIYALRPDLGSALPATVRVVVDGELTRGQTIIATSLNHQIALGLGVAGIARLADLLTTAGELERAIGEAITRAPHNAQIVLAVDASAMADLLADGLMRIGRARAVGE